ncbi:DUF5301 domain-containing protein [Facklamia sp. 7083-14-GEN3]|uniref:DUF5301 domain-containing protein n=1 Tax=Facklamia sp. 7083-14-GEN3 TaxID=2973478 RepID=UPI00215C7595|nr:DUF5301 domain-containing protein [Facklamia sp. 7083-14-GEN3]MCR8968749.1 DUF5301 domain-containing protein [Facklamia sp. 7083-14-GEN3]
MKKHIWIAMTLFFILSLTACGSNKKISLPEPDKITEIEVLKNNSESSAKVIEQAEISKMIEDINKNTKDTGKESINDQPVNIEDYIVIKFYHKNAEDSPSIAYLYKNKATSYLEQPYSGIWEITEEIYETINSKLTE